MRPPLTKPVTDNEFVGVSKPNSFAVHLPYNEHGGENLQFSGSSSSSQMVVSRDGSTATTTTISCSRDFEAFTAAVGGAPSTKILPTFELNFQKMRLNVPAGEVVVGGSELNPQNCLTIEVNQESENQEKENLIENEVKIVNNNYVVPVQIVHNSSCNSANVNINRNNNNNNISGNCDLIKDNLSNDDEETAAPADQVFQLNAANKGINVSIIENINNNNNNSDQVTASSVATKTTTTIINGIKNEQRIYISADSSPTNPNHKSEILVVTDAPGPAADREQRRRERRERRAARNRLAHVHPHPPAHPPPAPPEILPDLLHSHLPPPYTTLPSQQLTAATAAAVAAAPQSAAIITPIPVAAVDTCRYSFPLPIIRR